MGHRDYVYKWLFYALMTLFFILLQVFALVHVRIWGVHPFLFPVLVATVAALESAHESAIYALVLGMLLDITMPGRSGLEVLEEMLGLVPGARIIMCSAVGQEMMIQKALTLGAVDFIVKPFKTDEFSRIVNRWLEQ